MSDMSKLNLIRGNLNAAQHRAASFPKESVLQIVAGPGTGKTKTLVSRVAHLLEQGVPARGIVVTTFTNKAADELKERLGTLLADSRTDSHLVKAGTFHSICYRLLQKHGHMVGLRPKFTVADEIQMNVHLARVKKMLQSREKSGSESGSGSSSSRSGSDSDSASLKPSKMKEYISGLKVSNGFRATVKDDALELYQKQLEMSNHIDFDDILTKAAQLISEHPEVIEEVETVLVDEFQDTNKIQMELVDLFSRNAARRSVTVIGDPDQSIYKFRFATEQNFQEMRDMYPDTELVFLTENYRSTKPILDIAEDVIKQDTARYGGLGQSRKLTSHSDLSIPPELAQYANIQKEAAGMTDKIKELKLVTKSRLPFRSMAILCRTNRQAAMYEEALIAAKIPCYLAEGASSYWAKPHIRLIMAYLRCAYTNEDRLAFTDAMNAPRRRLAVKTAMEITRYLDDHFADGQRSVYHLLRDAANRKGLINITQAAFEGLRQFMDHIDHLRAMIDGKEHFIDEVMEYLLDKVGLREYVSTLMPRDKAHERLRDIDQFCDRFSVITETANTDMWESEDEAEEVSPDLPPLGRFFEGQALRVDGAGNDENGVAISTIHRSKGLEWPVVFLPNLSDSDFPNPDIGEERRLFFVALTRAKRLLYLSYSREGGGKSSFISEEVADLCATHTWTTESVNHLLRSLDLKEVDEMGVRKRAAPAEGYSGFMPASQLLKDNVEKSNSQIYGFKRASELDTDAPAIKKNSVAVTASLKAAEKAKSKGVKKQSSIFTFTKKSSVEPPPEDRKGLSDIHRVLPEGTEVKYRQKLES